MTDQPELFPAAEAYRLWDDCRDLVNGSGRHLPSCYRRLKLFGEETTDALGVPRGARVVSIDLDMVPVGPLAPLFDRPEDFVGWRVPGSRHPVVFNGSMLMFRAGACPHLWDEFDPGRSPEAARAAGYFGSDQGWVSYCMAGSGWTAGWDEHDGVYGYRAISWSSKLPRNARMISFCGKWKPWHERVRRDAPWLAEHYPA